MIFPDPYGYIFVFCFPCDPLEGEIHLLSIFALPDMQERR